MTQRIALVTGGNKGIGFAIVRALCKQLDNGIVYLTARNEGRGQEAVAKLNQEGLHPRFHQLDITDAASIERLRVYVKEKHSGLDVLVNNAGIAFTGDAPDPFGTQATVTMATNFTATVAMCRAFIPLVRPGGRIVTVSSSSGNMAFGRLSDDFKVRFQKVATEQDVENLMKEFVERANAGDHTTAGWANTAYGMTKLGVTVITKIMANDLARSKPKDDIIFTCCCPGYVNTDMSSHMGPKTIDEGADTPVYLSLLPPGAEGFNGSMYADRKLVELR